MDTGKRNFLRSSFEEYLNELGCSDEDMAPTGRMPYSYVNRYGTWLRRHDPIAFHVAYNEWILEEGD